MEFMLLEVYIHKRYMKKTIYFIAFLLFTIASLAQLPPPFWKPVPVFPTPHDSGGNASIVIHPATQHLFLGTIKEGIFKSENKGSSWIKVLPLQDTAVNKILVGPRAYLYAIAANIVFRSTDMGSTWTRHPVNTIYPITDIEFDAGRLVVSTATETEVSPGVYDFKGDGVFVSDDDAVTWSQRNIGIHYRKAVTHLEVNDYGVFFATMASYDGLGGGVLYSTDGAETWDRVTSIRFATPEDTFEIVDLYRIHSIETDVHDTIHISFEGSGGNFAVSGNIKAYVFDMMMRKVWTTERIHKGGFDWDNEPCYTYHFAKNYGHRYSSLHSPLSAAKGGPYLQTDGTGEWKRIPSGMLTIGSGYVKTVFAEDNTGRIYATQIGDEQLFYTDTSANKTTSVKEVTATDELVLYPNPANTGVNVCIKNTLRIEHIQLVNMNGVVCKPSVSAKGSNYYISLADVASGIYVVKVHTNQGIISQRLLVN